MVKFKNRIEIPLEFFAKCSALYPAQVKYLQSYQKRQTNPALKERAGILLNKPYLKDPIFDFDYRVDYSKYLRKVKIPQKITNEENPIKKKSNFFQKIFNKKE